jgi:hypothetical protein
LDEVLADFSGYIAADEAYDGPFCILFIVDNHSFKRLYYEVLDHDPAHKDIEQFFRRFKKHLDARGLSVQGITTDGSPLYPEPIKTVFGEIDHQICQFHVMQEINKQILKALTQVRRELDSQKAKCGRGRPCGTQEQTPRKEKGGFIQTSPSVCETQIDRKRETDPPADYPGISAATSLTFNHGRSLPAF